MAHGDYNCCLICDCKMDYNGYEAKTKENPCTDCLMVMREAGEIFLTPKELISRLKKLSRTKALIFLYAIGYCPCYYDNPTDRYLQKRGIVTSKAKDGAWGKRLRKLPKALQGAI